MRKYYFMSIALMATLVTSIGGQSASAVMGTDVLPAGGNLDFYELLDGSGSISASDFQLELGGTVAALNSAIVSPFNDPTIRMTVIQFGTSAVIECQQTITSQTDLNTLTACIAAISKAGGLTCMTCAYNIVTTELPNSPFQNSALDRSIVDLVTDGFPNSSTDTETAVTNAIAAGLDSNVALAVGAGASTTFLAGITHPGASPGPVDPTPIPDPLLQGFVLSITGFAEFEDAMKQKFDVIVPTVGGELLSIDTTALILAGAQTNAVWIMSALAAIGSVAFGVIYLKTRKN